MKPVVTITQKIKSMLSKSKGHHNCQHCNLAWVDEFIHNVKEYIYIREEDSLLIKRPNSAIKLNEMGIVILKSLLSGMTINQVLKKVKHDPQKICEISNFLLSVKKHLEGKNKEIISNSAVEVIPYEMNFSKYPVLSELALTYRCNLKCNFCYAGCNKTGNPVKSDQELSTQQLKVIIDKINNEAKVPSISFTGGEPTLRPDLPELIRYAKSLDMRVNLISNGTLINDEMINKFIDAGLDSAQISMEGTNADKHDAIVGQSGAFQHVISIVKALKKAGIHTHTNTTITRHNIDDCLNLPAFVKHELGNERFSMNLIIPTGSGALNQDLVVKYSEIGVVIEQLLKESEKNNVEFMWYSPIPMCMFNTIIHGLGNKGCSACDGLLSVAPNGDILPCASYDDPVGNLLQQDFDQIWQATQAVKYREKQFARQECRNCDNFHICNGACPLYWRQMGYQEFEQCKNERIDSCLV